MPLGLNPRWRIMLKPCGTHWPAARVSLGVPILAFVRRAAAVLPLALAMLLSACGGGGTNTTTNTWAGTYYTIFVLKGDTPDNFTGPDGDDPLIQAQVRQALDNRNYELGLFSVANASGTSQQLTLQPAPVLSYLYVGQPAYQIPGNVELLGDGLARLDLVLAGPQFAWQTLALQGEFDGHQVNDLVTRLVPYQFQNIVAGEAVNVNWTITGLNGSRLVQVNCTQRAWLYSEPGSVH